MTAKSGAGAAPIKRARTATVTYPYHPLELCIQIAEAVKRIGNGRSDVNKSMLASELKVSEQSADYAQKIASAKTFGIIHGKATVSLTETARNYFFPTDTDTVKKRSLLTFFSSPGAYKALIDLYDGTIPPPIETMGNVLHANYGVPESWRTRVAAQFLRSAAYSGAMGADGYLRFKAVMSNLGASQPTVGATPPPPIPGATPGNQTITPPPTDPQRDGIIVWTYPCNGTFLKVETPENMTKEIWEKLNKYIQVLSP